MKLSKSATTLAAIQLTSAIAPVAASADTISDVVDKAHKAGLDVKVEKVEEFVEELKKEIPGIQIIFVDERYTTTEAEHYLKNYSKKNGKERRKVVDMVAASIILQKYLDTLA